MAHDAGHDAQDLQHVVALLAEADLFRDLDAATLRRLAPEWHPLHLRGGQKLISEGDEGDAVYLLVSGRLRATTQRADGTVTLAELGRGQVVGEMALVDDASRNASVVAVRDSELLRLGADRFRAVIEQEPGALLGVARVLLERLRLATAQPSPHSTVRTLVIVGVGPPADVERFARTFAAVVDPSGAPVVDVRAIEDRFGAAAVRDGVGFRGETLAWLHGLERDHRYVVYLADAANGAWAERCIRQGDRVILAADADVGADAGRPAWDALRRAASVPAVDLVLLHPSGRAHPRGTAQWFGGDATFASHHHVRRHRLADHERVARLLTGRGVGVTLGGGGPRGFAHLGAVRALREAGVPIDRVGGTSIGSIMSGFVALDWDQETLEERALEAFTSGRRVVDRTLPLVALSSARRVESRLSGERFFGTLDLEDLWLPCFAVSSNLSRAEVVVEDRGPAWRAFRSSISLPGVFPPVWRDGDLHVDGGLVNNLPVDVMADRLEGGVQIAIDLEPAVDLRVPEPFPSSVSGWKVAAERLHPLRRARRIPGPIEVLLRSRAIGSRLALRQKLQRVPVDLYLTPPTGWCDPLDFAIAPELIERGYRYAIDRLARLDGRLEQARAAADGPGAAPGPPAGVSRRR